MAYLPPEPPDTPAFDVEEWARAEVDAILAGLPPLVEVPVEPHRVYRFLLAQGGWGLDPAAGR